MHPHYVWPGPLLPNGIVLWILLSCWKGVCSAYGFSRMGHWDSTTSSYVNPWFRIEIKSATIDLPWSDNISIHFSLHLSETLWCLLQFLLDTEEPVALIFWHILTASVISDRTRINKIILCTALIFSEMILSLDHCWYLTIVVSPYSTFEICSVLVCRSHIFLSVLRLFSVSILFWAARRYPEVFLRVAIGFHASISMSCVEFSFFVVDGVLLWHSNAK